MWVLELQVLPRRASLTVNTRWPWRRSLIPLRHILTGDFKISNLLSHVWERERENEQRSNKKGEYEWNKTYKASSSWNLKYARSFPRIFLFFHSSCEIKSGSKSMAVCFVIWWLFQSLSSLLLPSAPPVLSSPQPPQAAVASISECSSE